MSNPFYSIIIPTYNRADYVGRAVDCVLGQSCQDFELIVVDDGSTDNTESVIEARSQDDRLRYIKTVNMGASIARNIGIALANADWIAFLDSDDLWDENRLEEIKKIIDQADQLKWYFTDFKKINTNTSFIQPRFITSKWLDQIILAFGTIGATKNLIAPKNMLSAVDGFDPHLTSSQDTDIYYKLIRDFPFEYVPGVFSIHDLHSEDRITKNPNQKLGGLECFYFKHHRDMTCLTRNICKKKIFTFAWRFKRWIKILKYFPNAVLIKLLTLYYGVNNDRDLFLIDSTFLEIFKRR